MAESGKAGTAPSTGVAGRVYAPVSFDIEAESVASFARAIGADPAAGVPPTYAAVYSLGITAPQLFGDPEAAVDFANLLHAEQEFVWDRDPEVGETVTSQGRVASDVIRRGIRLLSFETQTTGADGAPLCLSRARFVIRS